ncbi:Trk system potassium transporter TrkA [Natronorarus salvus]|uniref:Trk system potassium transporter TrkA n=1 Tax=Natronorarus salvus TaxID=3117733 RepID=UPI002F262477
MKLVIVGAGEVGSSIAADLADSHEVVVVDRDEDLVEELQYSIDVLSITGDGTSLDTLDQAGVSDADMLIACTDVDETNIVACATASAVGDAFTIARVKRPTFLGTWERADGAFGVDYMVCTDLLTADTIVNVASLPSAHDADWFAEGAIQIAEFAVPEGSELCGQTVKEADRFDSLTFVGVLRDGEVEIASGETLLEAGAYVVVIGTPADVLEFAAELVPKEIPEREDVVVVGGSEIGFQCARLFEERGFSPRLIERERPRARWLAEELPKTVVLQSDATDVEFLAREHIDTADVVVAALGSDEQNLLICLLAKRLGASRAIAIVEHTAYVDLFETVGIDVAVSPREVTAEQITRFTSEGQMEKISLIHHDRAEAIEVQVDAENVFVGRPISEAITDLPTGVVIGAITRGEEYVTPRGDTVIEEGDHLVLFADPERIGKVASLL